MERMRQYSLPVIHAILVCDRVISEEKTRKKSLIGVFDTIYYTRLPFAIPELWVYVNLSDVLGEYSIRIELVHLDEERIIARIKSKLLGKPNQEIGYCFKNMKFAIDGIYVFRFWVNDDVIGEKYLYLKRRS